MAILLSGSSRPLSHLRRGAIAALLTAASACASGSGGSPASRAPAPAAAAGPRAAADSAGEQAPARLQLSEEIRGAADTVRLTGRELGSMWTFENPPLGRWRDRYGFRPDSSWLRHVRRASLRYGRSCSASFVSPDGLVMTNHHCARSCVESVSTEDQDYVERGFYAEGRSDEKLCPDLHLDQLVRIEEVTRRVRGAPPGGATDEEAAEARGAAREKIVEECESGSELRCQVVSLYHGGQYQLYKYRRYSPVKLVFAPELQAGFFGGVPDNFAYPRFALDVAFVRAYRPDSVRPVHPEHYFEWDPRGAGEGEPVFLTGNPGSTSRLATVSQLLYERELRHPFRLDYFLEQRRFLEEIAEMGAEAERQVRERLFQLDNVIELYRGELEGLRSESLMARKLRWQRDFRDSVRNDPELRERYGDTWDRIARVQAEKLRLRAPLSLSDPTFVGSPHVRTAANLVTWLRQSARPPGERAEGLDADSLARLEKRLRGRRSLSAGQSARILEIRLRLAERWLDPGASLREAARLEEATPRKAARRLVRDTRVGDGGFRTALMDAGAAALDTVADPLLDLAGAMLRQHRELQPRWDELTATEQAEEERLAEALFAVFGTQIPPDATFTLRISDGVVKGYPYNGTRAPAHTSFYGLYARSAEFENEDPFTLPHSFEGKQQDLDLSAPFDFVSTNDITGGNSGSPVLDREAHVVGVAFDGNHQQLPNEYLYRSEAARTVAVHSAGIIEALRAVYGADRLVGELLDSGGAEEGSEEAEDGSGGG